MTYFELHEYSDEHEAVPGKKRVAVACPSATVSFAYFQYW